MRDVERLFKRIEKSEDCQKISAEWKVELDKKPLQVEGLKMEAGSFVMAKVSERERDAFDAESTKDLERRMQNPMYSQPQLSMWGIVYSAKDKREKEQLSSAVKKAFDGFKYQVAPPAEIEVPSADERDWLETLRRISKPGIQCLLCLIPGRK